MRSNMCIHIYVAEVTEHVLSLVAMLEKEGGAQDEGVTSLKRGLLASVKKRLLSEVGGLNVLTAPQYTVPTALDPR